jgi:hypothetical protein
MMCKIHGGNPKPRLCHDCARAAEQEAKGRAPLRITEADRGKIRIRRSDDDKLVWMEGELPAPERTGPWSQTWD